MPDRSAYAMSSSETSRPVPPVPRRSPRGGRIVAIAVGLCLLLAAGWTIAWQLVSLRVEATLQAWIEQRRALGDRIEHGPLAMGGYPLTVTVTMKEVHWTRESGPTLLTAAAPELVATARVWSPLSLLLQPTRGARASAAGSWGALTGDAGRVEAVVALGRRVPERIDLMLRDLDLTGPGGVRLARIDSVDASIDPDPEADPAAVAGSVPTTLAVTAHAAGVRPAGTGELPFNGPAVVAVKAALRGSVDPTAGLPGLVQWRDAGGVIDVHRLSVSWSPVDLVGDGTFALDAALRPEGAGVAEIQGVAETLDRLVAQGRMKPGQAALLKLAAIAASEPSEDGTRQRLKAPVTVQDGTLRLGQFPVAKVRSIAD